MRLRKFSVAVVVRLLVLLVLMAFLSFVLWEKNWVATPFVLGGLIIFSTIELIYFIFRFQRHLGYALQQYRYEKEVPMQTDFPEVFKALQLIIQEKNREDQSTSLQLELFKKAIQLAPSAILLCDSKGDVVVQSEGIERLLGWKLGRQLKDIDDHCPGVFELLENLNGNGQLVLEAKAFNFQLAKDVFVDKKLLNIREVEFVMYEFTTDKGSSDEFEAWANFAKVVAHEIRNGISPVKSLANSLQEEVRSIPNDEVRNDFKSALSVIENRCDSLLEFTDKYRKLVRITTPQKDYFSLASLFEKLERLNAKQLEGVDYRREGDFEDFVLFGDEKQLMHVFENLLFNSLQAFDRNKVRFPKLRVELSEMKSEFLILFKDNGGGIPEEALPYIFLPFYTTQEEGSGIGLSVARQILAKHKGQINWVREKAPFTTFSIRIPKGRG